MGGAGRMALGAVREFVEHDEVEELVLADAGVAALRDRVEALDSSKVSQAVVDATDQAGMVAALEKAAAEGLTPPPPDDHKVLRVDVRGTKDGQMLDHRLESIQHPYPAWGMSCGAFTVGFLSAVTVPLLGRGVIEARGAFGGEACIPPEAYFAECNRRDIHVDVAQTCSY